MWDHEYSMRAPHPRPVSTMQPFMTLFHGLEAALADAAISLSLYEIAFQDRLARPSAADRDIERARMRQRTAEIERTMLNQAAIPPFSPDRRKCERVIRQEADREYRREKWRNGEVPERYRARMVTIYARSFVNALDELDGFLDALSVTVREARAWPWITPEEKLSLEQTLTRVNEAKKGFRDTFPELLGIRDSLAHYEERVQLKGKDKATRKPATNIFKPPTSGPIFMEFGSHYEGGPFRIMLADGTHGSIDITFASLASARIFTQQAIDAFKWGGSEHQSPY